MDKILQDSNGDWRPAMPRDARIAKSLTRDEARRTASNIAKLPALLGK
jgi:hypothetical protein